MKNEKKEAILYVDDEIENLDGFKYAFMTDFDISVAQNAKDGLNILEQKNIKVIISDQKMPEISGIEFLNTVKEKYPNTIRIILTAYADITNAIDAINKGEIYRYLSKPWEKTDLKSTIISALETYNLKQENENLIKNLKNTNNQLSITNERLNGTIVQLEENKEELLLQNEEYASLNEEYITINNELVSAKEKIEESNKLKDEFINNMSHEIRTPMNGILGFTEFLKNENLSQNKRKQYINIIQNSGNQLMRIIDDILEISKLGTKQIKTVEKAICLNDLLLEQFSIFDIKAKEKKIPLFLKNNLTDKESNIYTDETKLNKILSNLIENAIKYTNEGFIEFGNNLVQTDSGSKSLQIYVKDSGIGIKTENQKAIFERFSQEEKELSKNVGGLGLGLSIAKENTELLGGKITLVSEKEKGSTFYVTIPYKPVQKNIDTKTSSQSIKKNIQKQDQYTILIVEDEEINLLFLNTLIENLELNLKTLHAKHGKEAVEICKNNKDIDLVLMDMKMPIMNGFEATKRIKNFRPKLPIIAQTAYSTKEEKEQTISAGCIDVITNKKSFRFQKSYKFSLCNSSYRGNSRIKVVPFPCSDLKLIFPSALSIIFFTIASFFTENVHFNSNKTFNTFRNRLNTILYQIYQGSRHLSFVCNYINIFIILQHQRNFEVVSIFVQFTNFFYFISQIYNLFLRFWHFSKI